MGKFRLFALLFAMASSAFAQNAPEEDQARHEALESWQQVVRASPYWISQGVFNNLVTLRRWVLTGESYCARKERHILFDNRATFLGYIDDGENIEATQERLNRERAALAKAGRVDGWAPGAQGRIGYPFALSCNQPEARLDQSLARYKGTDESARLWGTWDGMRIGSEQDQVSLHEAIVQVYQDRVTQNRVSLPEEVLSTLAGKILIESGGRKQAHSAADARGVLQLSVSALNDCELDERFHFHRMAQIDCSLRLLEQNHRNLEPAFKARFGHLPTDKANELYALLLIQAYHGGVGRVAGLMNDPTTEAAASYFARHHERFSAGDIALGMVFHNLGRNQFGFASLYYVTDVGIATRVACAAIEDLPGCSAEPL
ncbi:hypothetical protein [Marinimicrobium sp. ABcell2]|uniref:hypothetical protein n=1 Tax=Marinimicrobium sp. ABcell2 TaxID=3069751 RepID=UPI0027B2D7D6|nr:hypothetical protein [Marinimicrobium sp. ABcell2]MDQ2075728.1 hypothetical protein [Marinimicrobium sp. ABcell2]